MPALLTTMSGSAVFGTDPLGERLDRVGVGHVEHVGVRDTAARGDLGGGVLDGGLVDVAHDHLGALAREGERGLAADSAAGAGDRHQRVAEVLARPSDLRAQQRAARRLALGQVGEVMHRGRHHLWVRHR